MRVLGFMTGTSLDAVDMAVLEIFLPLISGGAVVLARPGGHRNPAYIARLIQASVANARWRSVSMNDHSPATDS